MNKGAPMAPMAVVAKEEIPNPVGLTENVYSLLETPNQMLNRVLLPGEVVTAEFDCFFPTRFIPKWKIVMLLIVTLGLYALVMLWHMIRDWFYKNNCCTPNFVHFSRGKVILHIYTLYFTVLTCCL